MSSRISRAHWVGDLERRSERRHIGRANQYITEVAENEEYQEHEIDESQLRSSQHPRAKKGRLKSLESKDFQGF